MTHMDIDSVAADVAAAVGLAEGRSGVSDVLRAIARSEPVAVREVSRMAELPVPIVAGALQIFSGALLTRWTNGRLRTAAYRIVPEGTGPRRSVAIFYYQGFHQLPQLPFAELATPLRTATAAPPRTAA